MTWTEICNKYKDTELIKEFGDYLFRQIYGAETNPDLLMDKCDFVFNNRNIKDIWGYLICFAETKGRQIELLGRYSRNPEELMLKHTDKFFED